MIPVFVLLCVIFGMIYGFTARNLETDSTQLMYAVAGRPNLPGGIEPEGIGPEIKVPYLILQKNNLGLWTAQGSSHYDLSDKTFLTDLLNTASAQTAREGVLEDYDLRYLYMDGPVQRYVFMDISAERTTLQHLVRTCVMIGVLSFILFFGASLLLSRWAMKPVEAAWTQQKQFVADASHELKTPLAVILTNAELLEDKSYSLEEQKQFGQNILTMSYQMRHLVENLLELARLDNVKPEFHPVNFSELTETVLLPFEPVFFEENLILECSILPNLWVKGSATHLQQVLEIFLDNARKYSHPGTITVKLDKAGSHALIQVENPGVPLSDENAQNIFRRFYRTDPSRNRDGSYGLGLSIAEKIVQQHGGKIWAEGTETGNRFSLLIPLSHKEIPQLPQ